MTFPQIVATLMEAGFEGYFVDFRRGMRASCNFESSTGVVSSASLHSRFSDDSGPPTRRPGVH
jgi:hypothetical protein